MQPDSQYPTYDDVQLVRGQLSELALRHWLQHDLFNFNWWISLILTILPWIIWWRIADRSRVFEIFAYGLLIGIMSTVLDVIGADLLLWGYPNKLLSMIPPLVPADLSVIPVFFMLIYQVFSSWRTFLIATTVIALVFSFVAEPIFVWLNFYAVERWEYYYSFPIYILMAVIGKWIMNKLHEAHN